MEWIKCSERLPEEGDDIIAYNENNLDLGYIYCEYGEFTTYHPYSKQIGFYETVYDYGEENGQEPVEVTHWFKVLPCICKTFPDLPVQNNKEQNGMD